MPQRRIHRIDVSNVTQTGQNVTFARRRVTFSAQWTDADGVYHSVDDIERLFPDILAEIPTATRNKLLKKWMTEAALVAAGLKVIR